MTDPNATRTEPASRVRFRPRLVAVLLVGWTLLAGAGVWWLITSAVSSGNSVIRIGPDEIKTWSERLRETMALARLNFPWAIAWLLLAPYVLWVGFRFSFEKARGWRRAFVLLAAGAGFIWASQSLSQYIAPGQAMVVMVNFSTHSDVEISPEWLRQLDGLFPAEKTNRLITNHVTKVMVSGDATHLTDHLEQEFAAKTFLSALNTNLPQLVSGDGIPDLPSPRVLQKGHWSAGLDGLAYVALLGLAHAGVFHQRYREREKQATVLESRLNEARLHALQAQLQPHFLFNTLNGVATLLRRDPVAAEDMLTSLSDLLRIALSSSQRQEIPLREELDFLGRYLAIQRMRFGDRLESREEIEPAARDCLVPALVLQPLVENAIRHGLEPLGRPGWIRIAAACTGNQLNLVVEDNGIGLAAAAANQRGNGVGLANVRERLAALYGPAQELQIAERPEGGVTVRIRIPARTEAADAPAGNV